MLVPLTPSSSVLSLAICTSRSPPTTTTSSPLLALPAELRIHIYTYALADVVSAPLQIRHYEDRHTWQLRTRRTKVPSILLVCRQVHWDALDVLYQHGRRPRIAIEHEYNPYGAKTLDEGVTL